MDRQVAQVRQEAEEAKRAAREAQEQLAEVQLADATPEEREAHYKGKVTRLEQEQQRKEQEALRQAQLRNVGQTILDGFGLKWDTPGLELPETVDLAGLRALTESAAKLSRELQAASANRNQQQAQVAQRDAEIAAKRGVAQVSVGTGAPRPTVDLAEAYQAELAELAKQRPRNRAQQVVNLRRKYREMGYEPWQIVRDG
jgi:hypothetical protein